jgi:hypothetical protein
MISLFFYLLLMPAIAFGRVGKTVPCDDAKAQLIRVPVGRVTTLNFPVAPKDAVPGEGGFDIKRIQQDLVIKAIRPGASTNLVVYLESRRCFFHLASGVGGDESIFVRDPKEKTIEVKFVDK